MIAIANVSGFYGDRRGVADNLALDPQAKGLGEFVRARHLEVPAELMDGELLR